MEVKYLFLQILYEDGCIYQMLERENFTALIGLEVLLA